MLKSYWVSTIRYIPLDMKIYNVLAYLCEISLCLVSVPNNPTDLCLVEIWCKGKYTSAYWLRPQQVTAFLETNQLVEE